MTLELRPIPYKAVNASGVREYLYRIYENGVVLTAWHENKNCNYTGAIVRKSANGFVASPFKSEPTDVPDCYGIAHLKPQTQFTDGEPVNVNTDGIITL
jgi:hypothetical protein